MLPSPGSSVVYKAQIWDGTGETEDVNVDMDAGVRKSMYVDIFESMQDIVLEHERFLFSESELACLERLRTLSYPARYLLIRLCLCKRGKWHTLASLEARYKSEIGDKAAISAAIDELCGVERAAPAVVKQEVIDLTGEDECATVGTSVDAGSSSRKQLNDDDVDSEPEGEKDDLSFFAKDDQAASVEELLSCLPVDDLKAIAKDMKLPRTAQNRAALIDAILLSASQQSTLNFPVLAPRNNAAKSAKSGGLVQLTLNFRRNGKKGTQHTTVRRLMSKLMGRCVRIEPAIFALFDRLNLVFFRSTTHSPSLLLPALLTAFRKRSYGNTTYRRTPTIFPSREALLAYEEALMLEFRVDEILGGEDNSPPRAFTRKTSLNAKQSQGKGKGKAKVEDDVPVESSRVEGAKAVHEIWAQVYGKWKDLVACKDEENTKRSGLERFEYGHVLTRIVYKGARALGILKQYELEMQVLKELLSQTKWRRGRRGEWYDRLALVLMTHCNKNKKKECFEDAMDVVIRALKDDFTNMTYRPRLERRLTRIENMLKISKGQRHICDGKLQKAEEVQVEGVRLYQNRSTSVVLDTSGRVKRTTASPPLDRPRSETPFKIAAGKQPAKLGTSKGKTIWLGRNGDEVSVEQYALEYYEDLGFKGFHSEGKIVSMLFGLLFWDIIFAPIPGAFETPYQSAPLDIYEDSFYSARADIIVQRLKDLENGKAPEIIRRIDESKRPDNTWCIGVDWKFERDDLLEIVQCLGGNALSVICRTILEDYSQWGGGVPDLFVWNAGNSTCKFVEVKSPNDTLQENQKVWIDVLLGSGTSVDLCHITEKGAERKPKKGPHGNKKKALVESSDLESEDEAEVEAEEVNYDVLDPSQEDVEEPKGSKRARDSDEFTPSPKKRKMEATPRKRRRD